eukprot:TRINITY_DN1736_c0_g1_i1.p1 TRINITY_DN1736_c0_g1~~TRINITY_DN1736_c0_g1_i1.p1  ORF type:complete len:200 (-),score=26.77 TRINITY_DN1736_c0_g1_i1:39-638(-)
MDYNYQCMTCGEHCLSCYHEIRGCTLCEDGYLIVVGNECQKIESDKDWKAIMWVGIGLGIVVFISTIIGIWFVLRKPQTEFAKVGKTTYEVMLQSQLNKTTRKNIVHICEKCKGMCVRCNKKAGIGLASVCGECKIKGKCAICRQPEEGFEEQEDKGNTPDVEAAIEHENEGKEFELGRLCDSCAKIGSDCYNCGATIK